MVKENKIHAELARASLCFPQTNRYHQFVPSMLCSPSIEAITIFFYRLLPPSVGILKNSFVLPIGESRARYFIRILGRPYNI